MLIYINRMFHAQRRFALKMFNYLGNLSVLKYFFSDRIPAYQIERSLIKERSSNVDCECEDVLSEKTELAYERPSSVSVKRIFMGAGLGCVLFCIST